MTPLRLDFGCFTETTLTKIAFLRFWQNTKNGKAIWSNYEGQRNHDVILAITAFNFNKNIPKLKISFFFLKSDTNFKTPWIKKFKYKYSSDKILSDYGSFLF